MDDLIGRLEFIRDYECSTDAEKEAINEAIKALEQKPYKEQTTEQATKEFEEKLNSGYYRSQREEARQIEEEGISHEKSL